MKCLTNKGFEAGWVRTKLNLFLKLYPRIYYINSFYSPTLTISQLLYILLTKLTTYSCLHSPLLFIALLNVLLFIFNLSHSCCTDSKCCFLFVFILIDIQGLSLALLIFMRVSIEGGIL